MDDYSVVSLPVRWEADGHEHDTAAAAHHPIQLHSACDFVPDAFLIVYVNPNGYFIVHLNPPSHG